MDARRIMPTDGKQGVLTLSFLPVRSAVERKNAISMIKEKLLNSFVKAESIHLLARRWLDPSCGITYHTCEIWVNDCVVHKMPLTEGYGDQWEWNAGKWLADNSWLDCCAEPKRFYPISRICRKHGINYKNIVVDVERRKDL